MSAQFYELQCWKLGKANKLDPWVGDCKTCETKHMQVMCDTNLISKPLDSDLLLLNLGH